MPHPAVALGPAGLGVRNATALLRPQTSRLSGGLRVGQGHQSGQILFEYLDKHRPEWSPHQEGTPLCREHGLWMEKLTLSPQDPEMPCPHASQDLQRAVNSHHPQQLWEEGTSPRSWAITLQHARDVCPGDPLPWMEETTSPELQQCRKPRLSLPRPQAASFLLRLVAWELDSSAHHQLQLLPPAPDRPRPLLLF